MDRRQQGAVTGKMGASETDRLRQVWGDPEATGQKPVVQEGQQPGGWTARHAHVHSFSPQIITQYPLCANHSARPSKHSREQNRQKSLPLWSSYSLRKTEKQKKEVKYIVCWIIRALEKYERRESWMAETCTDGEHNTHTHTHARTRSSPDGESYTGETLGYKEREGYDLRTRESPRGDNQLR